MIKRGQNVYSIMTANDRKNFLTRLTRSPIFKEVRMEFNMGYAGRDLKYLPTLTRSGSGPESVLVRSWFGPGSVLVRSWFDPGSVRIRSWFGPEAIVRWSSFRNPWEYYFWVKFEIIFNISFRNVVWTNDFIFETQNLCWPSKMYNF